MTTHHQREKGNRKLVLALAIGVLIGVVAHSQTPPPVVRVTNALPEIVVNGGAIRHWTVNGREQAIFVQSNITQKAVVTVQSPRLGGTQTNLVNIVTLTTNAVRLLNTNGIVSYLLLPPTPKTAPRKAFVITGLQTSTDLITWTDVGWFCDAEPHRYFRTATNGLAFKMQTF